VRSASLWQARQPVHAGSVGRWRAYAAWLGPLADLAPGEAEAAGVAAASDAPEDAEALVHRATALIEDDQIAAAIVLLERAAALRPDDAVLHADLGAACIADDRPEAALAPLRRAAELDPTLAVATYNLGIACELLSRDEDALVAYRTALFVSPGLVEAHERLGNLLLARGELEAALGCFRRAADAAPDSARGFCALARLHLYEDRAADAEAALRRAEALEPDNAEVQRVLGRALQELGRFEEAIAAFARAVELEPAQVAALSGIVLSRKVTPGDADLLAGMDAALADPVRTDHERISLHFGLGKANDDLGRYETAIGHFDAANTLKSRGRPFDRDRFAAVVEGLMARYPGESAPGVGLAWETPVFIIGMPRSGTTLVEQILSSHAEVTGAGELTFWPGAAAALARKGGALTAVDALELAGEFRALLEARAPGALRVTDKNPFNFLNVGLIHAVFPRARFVHVRRDPVDTCLSNYFNDLIRQDFPNTKGDLVFYHAQYAALMAHWRAVLPASCLYDLDYETLIAERERVTRELVAFCGLGWDEACLEPEQNRRVVRTASLWQARQPVYRSSVARWRNYVPWLGELAALRTDAAPVDAAARSPVRVDTFSAAHLRKLRETHRAQERFGTHRHAYLIETMREVAHDLTAAGGGRPSLLDYGCGKGTFMQEMRALELFGDVTGYDPGIPGLDVKPDRPRDLVTCLDVLDQVEAGYRDQVVRDVAQFAGAAALFSIITRMAAHWAHLPVQRPQAWRSLIGRHMRVTRMIVRPSTPAEIAEGAAQERVIIVAATK
jgi:tetratricopeptide (TPR) repeat protein